MGVATAVLWTAPRPAYILRGGYSRRLLLHKHRLDSVPRYPSTKSACRSSAVVRTAADCPPTKHASSGSAGVDWEIRPPAAPLRRKQKIRRRAERRAAHGRRTQRKRPRPHRPLAGATRGHAHNSVDRLCETRLQRRERMLVRAPPSDARALTARGR